MANEAFERRAAEARRQWSLERSGDPPLVLVGTATCGRSAGALATLAAIREEAARRSIDLRIVEVGCLGHCYAEPLVVVYARGAEPVCYSRVTPGIGTAIVRRHVAGGEPVVEHLLGALGPSELFPSLADLPRYGGETRKLLARAGLIEPTRLVDALANGTWSGLARALDLGPERVIEEVRRAGLRGLGGAGFPTWRKWSAARAAPADVRYVVCNADEGDPGAFMDRTLLESDPHRVLEGMAIAAFAVGAVEGFVYVRAEYPLAARRVREAIEIATREGILGERLLGVGPPFRIQVDEGAGAFVCGESSALLYSLEGKRGMPRVRPPRSVERGLWGRPTVLNNVKTFAAAATVLAEGADAWASVGTGTSRGTAIFALAGKVVGTGLVEVPLGTTLRQIVFQIGGGVPRGRRFKAALIGGPSGGCLPEATLDLPVDFDSLAAAGGMLGSGGLIVLDEDDCMVEVARYFLEFTQRESCGKCTFCRIGTRHMLDLLRRITEGNGSLEDLDRLETLAEEVRDGSLCNLGATAPNPVRTTLRWFRDEYVAHVTEKRCPAKVCRALIRFRIDPDRCAKGCEICVRSCPVQCIDNDPHTRKKIIDPERCVRCGACQAACPPEYDAVARLSPRDTPAPGESRREGGTP